MKNAMMTIAEVSDRINDGAVLVLAGSEQALSSLPKGKWIGGTSVYFVTDTGGRVDRDNVHVTEIMEATDARTAVYQGEDLANLTTNRFEGGVSMILIPAFSAAHAEFAIHGASYPGLFDQPLMGWITGVHLDDLGRATPKIFDGATGMMHEEGAALLHVALADGGQAELDILNLFIPDSAADSIVFTDTGFAASRAIVNGEETDFPAYVKKFDLDTRLPLVADYAGAMVNVSFQAVNDNDVQFYAPVIAGVTYRLAKSPGAYADAFASHTTDEGATSLSCNCILNYLYGELEGNTTGSFTGPATFGEVAYVLLNQTLVKLDIRSERECAAA
ncbi:hypothetical protein E4191_09650 [Paracoccus liaowanqingii]|uniref:Uncharacterized protein n=1 Tax=Paracoccus liaowanqingii TaxID=2560053 RepID=A0A4P7HL55_9RHOB|nr:hypothetical protein [Paracoccus liaowanqingii]QBX34948.1 hypothetical protein E4191_09650 [Paracoccus liaowanqingii]